MQQPLNKGRAETLWELLLRLCGWVVFANIIYHALV
jgi:hypothetical protein